MNRRWIRSISLLVLVGTILASPSTVVSSTDPQPHTHWYWGDLNEVAVFYDEELALDQDPLFGGSFGCRTLGHRQFNLETDGDDVGPFDGPINYSPPNGGPPRADTVFAGTGYLRVELLGSALPPLVDVFLRFRPANLNFFVPENGCGLELTVGNPLYIPVAATGADPAHNWYFSRHAFMAMAADNEGGVVLPAVGHGSVALQITAVRIGEPQLDPAHPNPWGESLTYDLGCTRVENIEPQIVVWSPGTGKHVPPREPLTEIGFPHGRLVPMLTEKVTIRLEFTSKGPVPGATLELWYHGTGTDRYEPLEPRPNHPGRYVVRDNHDDLADSPYVEESYWRFLLVPRPPTGGHGDQPSVAEFQGSYSICAAAHRYPDAILA